MKKLLLFLSVFMLLLAVSFNSYATLSYITYQDEQVVYDDTNNQYWYWDLGQFTHATYDEQLAQISDLNLGDGYYDITDWHMASYEEMAPLWDYDISEIAGSFNPSVITQEAGTYIYWDGRFDESYVEGRHGWASIRSLTYPNNSEPDWFKNSLANIGSVDGTQYGDIGAWVTASGTTATPPVPEPATIFLLSTGLVGLVGFRKKFKK